MKIILDNGKEYEFAVGTSEHNVMQAMLNIINNDNTPNIEEICKCFSLETLQPLYSRDNLAKSSWYEGKLYRNGKPV